MQFAGTMQLAALGPTSVIFSFSSYVFNALGIATTSKVSSLLGQDKIAEASQCAGAALVVAVVAGIISFLLLEVPLSTFQIFKWRTISPNHTLQPVRQNAC
jgi:Na+-driven multidrug efflux pump